MDPIEGFKEKFYSYKRPIKGEKEDIININEDIENKDDNEKKNNKEHKYTKEDKGH